MTKKTRSAEKTPQAKDESPNLSSPLPFVHCKIVFNLKKKVSDKVDCEKLQDKSEGWNFENNRYVYYETLSSKNDKMNNNENPGKQTSSQMADTSEESGADSDNDDIFTASFLKLINQKEKKAASQKFERSAAAAQRTTDLEGYEVAKRTSNATLTIKDSNRVGYTLEKNINVLNPTKGNNVVRSNTDDKPFKCSFCSKAFTRKRNLIDHQRIHTGETPYKCPNCQKIFTRKEHLNCHMRIHTGEKPFKCSECSKQFSDPSALKTHMRRHTGETPFKCPDCLKTFYQSSNLKYHLLSHTGDRPFKCSVCLKRFYRSSDLKPHMRVHTGEQPFQCSECSQRFSDASSFKRHTKRKHGGRMP